MNQSNMQVDLSNKVVLCYDYGNYIEIAMRLARDFGKVYYFCDWQSAYPKYDPYVVGDGINEILPNFHHIHSIWEVYDEVDLWYFPDLYQSDFQQWLKNQGRLVFGACYGEGLELQREKLKVLLSELGLSVNEYQPIEGLNNLREHLMQTENVWIKTNIFRGSMESFFHKRYELSKPRLDRFEHTLGVYKDRQHFLVEQNIEDSKDFAAELISIDGNYTDLILAGMEKKNEAYLGVIIDYHKLPKQLKEINTKLSPILKEYGYRGAFTPECRLTKDKKAYLLDPCCRAAQPPTSLTLELYDNFSEIVWLTANGVKPIIRTKYKYGGQLIIKSEYSQKEPQAIYFPEHIRDYVKIKNLCIQDGVWYYIPQEHDMSEIGGVVGMADTIDGAIYECIENAKLIEGDGVYIETDSLEKAKKEIQELKEYGINFF